MRKNPKIAVVQCEIDTENIQNNLDKADKYIKQASGEADVIVFPEDFITGPYLGEERKIDRGQRFLEKFKILAKKYKIDVIPGSYTEEDKGGLYNTTYYIKSTGHWKQYRKVNLWLTERSKLTPGNEFTVYNTSYGKIGLVICWDLNFPELFRRMSHVGVEIVFCPSLWYSTWKGKSLEGIEHARVNALCSARAFENNIFVVYCNACGKIKKKNYTEHAMGYSQIADPWNGNIKILEHDKEKMFIQELNMDILRKTEIGYRTKGDLKHRVL